MNRRDERERLHALWNMTVVQVMDIRYSRRMVKRRSGWTSK
ncbi:hypothetical protein [Cohnella boryungensis]|uniref:Uncharacterized protein n=1 Tax=Cohnella boryungensis TaxID=768479 RepID=A0ABV8SIJ9_9BACL